jgi:hypothetical protein
MRKVLFGGPNLKPKEWTWFEARLAQEPDPDTGELVWVGGNVVHVTHGDVIAADDMGVWDATERAKTALGFDPEKPVSWADYHVQTGRASWRVESDDVLEAAAKDGEQPHEGDEQ